MQWWEKRNTLKQWAKNSTAITQTRAVHVIKTWRDKYTDLHISSGYDYYWIYTVIRFPCSALVYVVDCFNEPLPSWKLSWAPLSKQRANGSSTITHSAPLCLWRNHCICQIHQPFPQRHLPACETDHLPWGLQTIVGGAIFYCLLKYLLQEGATGLAIKRTPWIQGSRATLNQPRASWDTLNTDMWWIGL